VQQDIFNVGVSLIISWNTVLSQTGHTLVQSLLLYIRPSWWCWCAAT